MFDQLANNSKEALPIEISTNGIFDKNDQRASFLIEKLQAWINFQALASNWYADESYIINIKLTLVAEKQFLNLPQYNSDGWIKINAEGLTALLKCGLSELEFESIVAVSNSDLKEMMDDGSIVEPQFQSLIMTACNYLTKDLSVNRLI
ncbi:hypothetical protein [Psychrosphaera aestuarii]|uniref:hypothetical protein n=1 Tax=Psychrosphaera aestuarii TaxID=1266052 RepID=UPI001B31AA7D|nr:hypothetical protein [Psychrosphaera aestuarii]